MKKTPTILLLLGLLLLVGCNDPKSVTDTLHRAEALMNEHPDSAWAVLNTLSADEMGQNRIRALYALLYTQAQDKTYRDETNDSLISIAVDYYRHTDDVRRKFLSYYYKGRVHFNAKDYLNATTYYMEAEQLADAVGDDYLTGLLYAELGRIYDIYYDYPKSLKAYQKAADCYGRAGKIRHRNYMWLNQSGVCRNMKEYDKGKRLLQLVLAAAKEDEDYGLMESCLGDLVMLCIEEERMSEAKAFYAELKLMVDEDYGSPSFLGKLAQLYALEGDFIQAKKCLEQGWSRATDKTDSVSLYISFAGLHRLQGENALAYQELQKGVTMQNGEARQALQQPVLTAQRDYLSEKLMFETYRRRVEERLNLLYILVSVLTLVIVTFMFVRVFKKYKKKSRQVISELEKEKAQVIKEKDGISLQLQKLDEDKKEADKTIEKLKNEIARNEKESNEKITKLLQKLESNKEESNRFIADLRQELADKARESDVEISDLLQKMESGKEEAHRSIADLKQTLAQKEEENRRGMASLSEKMEYERVIARKTIQDLNDLVAQKEESRTKMAALIQKLENESKQNVVTISGLREGLEQMQKEHDVYARKAEYMQAELQEKIHQYSAHAADLFRAINSDMSGLFVVVKEKKVAIPGICKVVYRWKEDYCVGKRALDRLEHMVNCYCDDAMSHFREEVILGDEEHYQRVCYWFAGVSIKAVALLMAESKDNVYQRRLRLREKIESSDYPHKQIYLKLLGK